MDEYGVFCVACGAEQPRDTMLHACEGLDGTCESMVFVTQLKPKPPMELTYNDRRFLRALRIQSDEPLKERTS